GVVSAFTPAAVAPLAGAASAAAFAALPPLIAAASGPKFTIGWGTATGRFPPAVFCCAAVFPAGAVTGGVAVCGALPCPKKKSAAAEKTENCTTLNSPASCAAFSVWLFCEDGVNKSSVVPPA